MRQSPSQAIQVLGARFIKQSMELFWKPERFLDGLCVQHEAAFLGGMSAQFGLQGHFISQTQESCRLKGGRTA